VVRLPDPVRVVLTFVVLACVASCGSAEPPTGTTRPNVIILLADDLGWADVGFHGSEIRTPNIDRLAREGVELDRFYTAPVCTPTRAGLLTGRHPIRIGLAYSVIKPWIPAGLSPDEHLLSQTFKAAGYRTAAVGKWHLGVVSEEYLPRARGFDHFYGHLNGHIDYFEHTCKKGIDWQRNGITLREEGYSTDLIGAEAARLIHEFRDEPFFLYVAFNAPHPPLQAPRGVVDEYREIADSTLRVHAAMVDVLDRAVGRIVNALDAEDIADDTVVVFLSDNGGLADLGRNAPLRGGKGTTFEGGIRVPAVMRWPGRLPAGARSEQLITPMDLFPTLAEAAGVTPRNEKPLDGIDLWSTLAGGGRRERERLFFVVETDKGIHHAVIDGASKLVRRRDPKGATLSFLFHLERDPGEANDLATEMPERVAELSRSLDEWLKLHPDGGLRYSRESPDGWSAPQDWTLLDSIRSLPLK
jgi:arylsulfatase A-like enzyme